MSSRREPGMPPERGKASGSGQKSRYSGARSTSPVRWGECDGSAVIACMDALQSAGDALLMGCSRDGNVLIITVCSGDERVKFYAKSAKEMNEHLFDITASALGLSGK